MKELEELKKMIGEIIARRKPNLEDYNCDEYDDLTDDEIKSLYERDLNFFEEFKNYNFLGYNIIDNTNNLFETYSEAKNYVEEGGQILVIDKEKVYNYKIKTEDEYFNYLNSQIKSENLNKKNYYGL